MSVKQRRHRTGAAATINPDHIGMHRLILVGVVGTLLSAVLTSWNGLVFVARAQLLADWLLWITPVMIDVPLIVLTLARGALRKRGIRTRGLLVGIIALTVFSSTANGLHTIAEGGFDTIPAVVGTVTNALAPWLILAMTEVLWLVVTRPIRVRSARARKAAAKRVARPRPVPVAQDPLFELRESAAS